MNRIYLATAVVAFSLPLTVGCASKKYVRNEVTPTVNKVNELDDLTAKNTRDIRDTDTPFAAGHPAGQVGREYCRSEGAGSGTGRESGQPERYSGLEPRDQPGRHCREYR